MMIGYARVSTGGQDLDQQRAALKAAGCTRIYEEKVSGAKRSRPELAKMLDHLRAGQPVNSTFSGKFEAIRRNDPALARALRKLIDAIAET